MMLAENGLHKNSVVTRTEEKFLISRFGNEIAMMDMESGDYLGINSVAADVWDCIAEPTRVSDLVDVLLSRYDVSPEQCEQETLACLGKMSSHGIIRVVA